MTPLQAINKCNKEIKRINGMINMAIKDNSREKVDLAFGIADDNLTIGNKIIFDEISKIDTDIWYLMNIIEASKELNASWKQVWDRMCKFYIESYL